MKYFCCVSCLAILLMSCFFQDKDKSVSITNEYWKHDSTTHFKLHAQGGVRSENNLQSVGQKMELLQHGLLKSIGETKPLDLEIYFLKDRETLTSYTGFPANGYTNTQKGIIYFVDKDPFHLALRHELMHALSWHLWGTPEGYWLSEGIAVYASGSCSGYDLHALAHNISKQDKIVSFQSLTDTFDFASLEPSLQSASMVQYIFDNYGIKTVKSFWQNGLKNAKSIIGISALELEQNWHKHIDEEKYQTNINWDKIKQNGCE